MAKGGGSTRTVSANNASASRTSDKTIKKGGRGGMRKVNNKEKYIPTTLTQKIEQIDKKLKGYENLQYSEKNKIADDIFSILKNAPVSTIISTKDNDEFEVQYKKVNNGKDSWVSSNTDSLRSTDKVVTEITKFSKTIKLNNSSKWFD